MTDNEAKKHTDLYSILEISEDATQEEIQKKYNEMIKIHHPDKGGSTEFYIKLKLAYKILSDPEKRKKYQTSLAKTFNELKSEYKNEDGTVRPLPYEEAPETAKNDFINLKDKFNTVTDKKLTYDLNEDKYEVFKKTLKTKLIEREEDAIIDKLPEDMLGNNMSTFHQIFEFYKTSDTTGIKPLEDLVYIDSNVRELASYDIYDREDGVPIHSVKNSTSWVDSFGSKIMTQDDYRNEKLRLLIKQEDVTDVKADQDFYKIVNDRLKNFKNARENLLTEMASDKFEFKIRDEHNNILSYDKLN